jgi:hypothetical protein
MLLASVGDIGSAILLIFTLVGVGIGACYLFGYAGICLLSVVQETASGNEELSWPDDALVDKAGRAMYFGMALAVILIPVGILARALQDVLFPEDNGLRLFVLVGPGLWLLLPVGLLSSLSSTMRWLMFRPAIVVRMLRLFPATALFYLTTALMAGLAGCVWYKGLFILLLAAPLSGWLWLLYARLLGRLAALIGLLGPLSAAPISEARAPLHRPRKVRVQSHDPWAVPEEREVDQTRPVIAEGEVVEPYLLSGENKPVYPDSHHLAGKVRESKADKAERLARKRQLAQRSRSVAAVEGIGILFRGLATFPVQGKTFTVLVALSFGYLAVGGGVIGLIAMAAG